MLFLKEKGDENDEQIYRRKASDFGPGGFLWPWPLVDTSGPNYAWLHLCHSFTGDNLGYECKAYISNAESIQLTIILNRIADL